jgi:hypothetical protein
MWMQSANQYCAKEKFGFINKSISKINGDGGGNYRLKEI